MIIKNVRCLGVLKNQCLTNDTSSLINEHSYTVNAVQFIAVRRFRRELLSLIHSCVIVSLSVWAVSQQILYSVESNTEGNTDDLSEWTSAVSSQFGDMLASFSPQMMIMMAIIGIIVVGILFSEYLRSSAFHKRSFCNPSLPKRSYVAHQPDFSVDVITQNLPAVIQKLVLC